MTDYLVLARKYRSATFEEVVGQQHVAETLVSAIKTGRVAHAFLFSGTRGVGKTTMARILAKALNCLSADGPTAAPCNKCDACVAIARGDDLDVIEIDGASNRGIDEVRELRSNTIYRPSRCRYKIYYIDEVHMLTREAFNALLKTLEEPPEHVKFIFSTTQPERLPATVISRCQRFDFHNIPTALIAEHLAGICKTEEAKADEGAIYRIARAGAGSMRDSLSLLDQLLSAGAGNITEADVVRVLGTPGDERTASIVSAIAEGDPAGALGELDSLLAAGVTLESAIKAVGEMFRTMMLASACGADSELIELPDSQRKTVGDLAAKFTLPALVQAVSICQTTARNLRGLTGGRGLVEAAIVRLAAAEKFVDAASLVERLEQLSGAGGAAAAPKAHPPRAGTTGQKKKTVAPGARAAPDSAGAYAAPAATYESEKPAVALENPRWEREYLLGHWDEVVAAAARAGQGYVSGLLAPAKVLEVSGPTLRLGFDAAQGALQRRCEGVGDRIDAALGKLFGRQVHCEYVPTGEPGEAPAPKQPLQTVPLSTAERNEIGNDPAVKAVLEFFGGTIEAIRSAPPPGDEEAQDQEPKD